MTSALFFDNVVVPEANLLPNVKGLKGPLSCLTQARYGITWGVIGAAQACLAQLIDYTKTRELFGKPLANTQAIQLRLADMARKITAAQLLSHQLGRLKDQGKMQPAQVSLAKWNNCRMALDIARDCRDMLGGSGISAEYVPIRHMLNLESVITYEGTETIHQLTDRRELTGTVLFEGCRPRRKRHRNGGVHQLFGTKNGTRVSLKRGQRLAARGQRGERLEHDPIRRHPERVVEKREDARRRDIGLRHALAHQPLR